MIEEVKNELWDYTVYRRKGRYYNKTTLYLLPALDIKLPFKLFVEMGLIDVYCDWEGAEETYNNCLFILMNPRPHKLKDSWDTFHEAYSKMGSFVCSVDIEFGLIMLVFRLKSEYKGFPKILLSGKYSQFPETYARKSFRVLNYKTNEYEELYQFKVIKQKEDRRKELEEMTGAIIDPTWEYDSVPELEEEVFNLEQFKKAYGK